MILMETPMATRISVTLTFQNHNIISNDDTREIEALGQIRHVCRHSLDSQTKIVR